MPESAFDLIVIGAGPGGYTAAIRAAQLGMRVACIEKDPTLGGTCLNVGCIPSKALLDSSERYAEVRSHLGAHGIKVAGVELDLVQMLKRKDDVVGTLTKGVAGLFRKHKITAVHGTARLAAAGRVEVSGPPAQTLTAPHILIVTGSAPIELPSAPFDGTRIVCSTEALTLSAVPKRMLVLGGGAIGLEMGSVWSRLGSEVLVVEMLDRLVPGMDSKMAALLQRALGKQGLKFKLGTTLTKATASADGVRVALQSAKGGSSEELCDVLLVAVGRRPYTEGLGLETVGVALDSRGRIPVDAHFATTVPGLYAVGDVIAGPMLAHKAEEEGVAAVEHMAGLPGHVNYEAIPSVVYTAPELAAVGLSEDDAQARGLQVKVGSFPYMANARAKCMGETEGAVKVVADAASDRVLGVHILGPHASDVIAEAALAMEFGASAEDIGRTVHAHPTLAEALKEAALAVDGRPLNI
ncbi:MAG: dihydrolipoyl dehydrogenase [Candidatus Binatia bacterium]